MSNSKPYDNSGARARPFTSLNTNFKGPRSTTLGPCTAFVDRDNQSGKTGLLDAIYAAACGWHPIGHQGTSLWQLAPENATRLYSELVSPGGNAKFEVDASSGKPASPTHAFSGALEQLMKEDAHRDAKGKLDRVMPAQQMSKLIDFGPDLGRRALFARFGGLSGLPDAPEAVKKTEEQHLLWLEGVREVKKKDGDPGTQLGELHKWFGSKQRTASNELTAAKTLNESRKQQLQSMSAGAEQLPGLRSQLVQATLWEGATLLRQKKAELEAARALYMEQAAPHIAAAEKAEETAAEEAKVARAHQDAVKAATAAVEAAEAAVQAQLTLLSNGTAIINWLSVAEPDEDGRAPCLMCGNPEFQPQAALDQIEPRVTARQAEVQKCRDALQPAREAQRAAMKAAADWEHKLRAEKALIEADKNRLRAEATRIQSTEESINIALGNVPSEAPAQSAESLKAQIAARAS